MKINNKIGMFNWTKLIVGILLASLFIVVIGGAYVSMANTYGITVSDKYSKLNDRFTRITNETTSIGNNLQGGGLATTNPFVLGATSLYSGFQIILNTIAIPKEMIGEMITNLGIPIPKVFIGFLLALLSLAFVYIIMYAFGKAPI